MFPIRDTLPATRRSVSNWLIILLNGWVFWYQLNLTDLELEAWVYELGVVPAQYTLGGRTDYWPWLTTMFVHGGWFHILANLWSLWIFGDNVEAQMGRIRYVVFFLLAGLGGTLAHVYFNPASTVPVVGASGAISGVMAAYFFLFPAARIVMLFPIFFIPFFFQIPAWLYILAWIAMETLTGLSHVAQGGLEEGGVAVWAHVGGFATGAVLYRLFLQNSGRQESAR
jgi:membrane associated rhomboid family serine protease